MLGFNRKNLLNLKKKNRKKILCNVKLGEAKGLIYFMIFVNTFNIA